MREGIHGNREAKGRSRRGDSGDFSFQSVECEVQTMWVEMAPSTWKFCLTAPCLSGLIYKMG